MQKDNRVDKGLADDVAAVIGLLPRLVRGRRFGPGVGRIGVSVEEQGPGVMECIVTIDGDTEADKDAIKAKFKKKDGWTCTDDPKDKTKSVCTNP